MSRRTFLHLCAGLFTALILVAAACATATGTIRFSAWVLAQAHMPLLWMLDGCALFIFLGIGLFGEAFTAADAQRARLKQKHAAEISLLKNYYAEAVQQNTEFAAEIVRLQEAEAQREAIKTEVSRLIEPEMRAIYGLIDSNARRLETLALALQYRITDIRPVLEEPGALYPPARSLTGSSPEQSPVDTAEPDVQETLAECSELPETPTPQGIFEVTANAVSTVIVSPFDYEVTETD